MSACIQKTQLMCYVHIMSSMMEDSELQEALDVIETTNLKYFVKDQISEFMAPKGSFIAQIGHSEEVNKCLSASVQIKDDIIQNWALWGEYLYQLFEKDRNLTLGLSVVTCYLQALHGLNVIEGKARKYLACIINMLSYDDEKGTLAEVGDVITVLLLLYYF